MDLTSKVFIGVRWMAFGRLASALCSWGITLIVIRILSPDDYGLLNIGMIVIGLTTMIGEFGIQAALIRLESISTTILRQCFGIIILSYFGLAAIVVVTSPLVASFYNEDRLLQILPALAIPMILTAFTQIPSTLLLRDMNYKPPAIIAVVATLLSSFATLTVALLGGGVWALIVGQIVMVGSTAIGLNFVAPFPHFPSFSFVGMSKILTFGVNILMQRVAWWLYSSIDRILIGKLLSVSELGYYSVALHLASIPRDKIAGIINQVAYPAFARLNSDRALAESYLLKALSLMAAIFLPIFFGMSVVAAEAVPLVLGEKWSPAIIPMTLLPLVMPFRMLTTPIGEAVNALGHPIIVFVNLLFSIVIMTAATIIGARWGTDGVATGLCVAVLINIIFMLFMTKRITGIGPKKFAGTLYKPFAATMVMCVIVFVAIYGLGSMIEETDLQATWIPWVALVSYVLLGVSSYTVALFLIDRQIFSQIRKLLIPN